MFATEKTRTESAAQMRLINFYIDPIVYEQLVDLSQSEDLPVAAVIRRAIAAEFKRREAERLCA